MKQEVFFLLFFDGIECLTHRVYCSCAWRYFNTDWIIKNGVCKTHDTRRHRCRKEQCLSTYRNMFQYFFDVIDKSHIQHTICFIENEYFNLTEIDKTLIYKIQQSSRRRDKYVYSSLECFYLFSLTDSAINNRCYELTVLAIRDCVFFDLNSEFSGRCQDKTTNRFATSYWFVEQL